MTKSEAIQKAYEKLGMDWDQIKNLVTEGGILVLPTPDYKYSLTGYENLILDKDHFVSFGTNGLKLMPSSLYGLYSNRGWLKVESEEDFPTDENVMYRIGMFLNDGRFHQDKNLSTLKTTLEGLSWNYTHYMPVPLPEDAIY